MLNDKRLSHGETECEQEISGCHNSLYLQMASLPVKTEVPMKDSQRHCCPGHQVPRN